MVEWYSEVHDDDEEEWQEQVEWHSSQVPCHEECSSAIRVAHPFSDKYGSLESKGSQIGEHARKTNTRQDVENGSLRVLQLIEWNVAFLIEQHNT